LIRNGKKLHAKNSNIKIKKPALSNKLLNEIADENKVVSVERKSEENKFKSIIDLIFDRSI
jgi:hypothetical protein